MQEFREKTMMKTTLKPDWRRSIDHRVIFSITMIIVICLVSTLIVAVSTVWTKKVVNTRNTDEVITMFGQIASTGIGALAGYFTSRVIEHRYQEDPEDEDTDED